jgi:23S rRNA pseudouridine1911/1915/1917 synthase
LAKRRPRHSISPKNGRQVFHLAAEHHEQTLAAAVRDLLGVSWGEARRLIAARRVQVNGNVCVEPQRKVTRQDVLHLFAHPISGPPQDDDVRVRFQDAHLVVIEKPAGITTMRHADEMAPRGVRRNRQPTLDVCLNRILAKRQKQRAAPAKARSGSMFSRAPRVRPVHRLDRETSGLMVFALTVGAEQHLAGQFARHSIARLYLAVVAGNIRQPQRFESTLVRDRGDGRRGSTVGETPAGKLAITHVVPVEQFDGYTLVECRLETGRTHQIRIHLSEAGHPVCGDKLYRGRKFSDVAPDESGAPRLALHAAHLTFVHPSTKLPMQFDADLPQELADFVGRLRRLK